MILSVCDQDKPWRTVSPGADHLKVRSQIESLYLKFQLESEASKTTLMRMFTIFVRGSLELDNLFGHFGRPPCRNTDDDDFVSFSDASNKTRGSFRAIPMIFCTSKLLHSNWRPFNSKVLRSLESGVSFSTS